MYIYNLPSTHPLPYSKLPTKQNIKPYISSLFQLSSPTKTMCNPNPSSPSLPLSSKKTHNLNLNKSADPHEPDTEDQLHRWPTPSEVKKKKKKEKYPCTHTYEQQ
jgi:hypothetical protein